MSADGANFTDFSFGVENATQNGTSASATSPPSTLVSWDFAFLSAQVMASAMTIIWMGANSSLCRPPSAAPAKSKDGKRKKEENFIEGFAASDAIMFPLLAGTVLVGLYYLIKWLQDPDLLNRILRGYLSLMSVASLGKLSADALHLLTSIVFPRLWTDRSGRLHYVELSRRNEVLNDTAADVVEQTKKTFFSSLLSKASLGSKASRFYWQVRHFVTESWTLRVHMIGIFMLHGPVKLNDILGFFLATLVVLAYYVTSWSWLSNILGSALCYASFTVVSPTSFAIGTMVLAGLFVYDIVMVFYTPYMITVATKLDVPIKLTFQSSSRSSMLGLGDIVIPGIFIALALRFDLWQYYQKQIKYIPVELKSDILGDLPEETKTVTQTQHRAVKVPYISPKGQWGDWLWTTRWRQVFAIPTASPALITSAFPKTYFRASMIGYALGMLLTLVVMIISNHGQPALLYLVPCVTGSVWLTGFVRGETHDLWTYTEDGSLDTEDIVVELDGDGAVIKTLSEKKLDEEDGNNNDSAKGTAGQLASSHNVTKAQKKDENSHAGTAETDSSELDDYEIFLFSLTAPKQRYVKQD